MTLTELCEELKRVTYGESPNEPSELAPVVNMSLSRLYSDLGLTSHHAFYKNEILPIEKPLSFHRKGGENLTLPLAGRAYGMHVSGCGTFSILDGVREVVEEVSFDTFGEFYSGSAPAGGIIRFTGDLSYDVYSLSFYDEIGSEDLSDIPSGYPKRYILSDMIPDFSSPASMPRDALGNEIDGAEYIGDTLFIPTDYKGLVSLKYYRLPERVSGLTADEPLSLEDKYLTHLLHLVAYYSLLEGEPTLAEKHLDAYLAMLPVGAVKQEHSEMGEYLIEDGWA